MDQAPGARRSPGRYDQSGELVTLDVGDRLFIPCNGGPASTRLETFPPRLEIEERTGLYVLVDDGPRDSWRYEFIPREG